MRTIGLIPARLHSTRLPGKLLLAETGQPLLQHTWETALRCPVLSEVIIATDSDEIAAAVEAFGGRVERTGDHPSGTDRIAEVVRRCSTDADIVVNIQGDEPELEPDTITQMVRRLEQSDCDMATAATPLRSAQAVRDPSCVKVVLNDRGEAMYFSRAPIPHPRDCSLEDTLADQPDRFLLHLGMYAYRRDFLIRLTQMPPGDLEQVEKLEQLRALQAGARIAVVLVPEATVGIDTADDYRAFVGRMTGAD